MNDPQPEVGRPLDAHEGSWVFVSGPTEVADSQTVIRFCDRIAAACEGHGWHVYKGYRSKQWDTSSGAFERVRHAVEHADAVVVYIGASSTWLGAELALAHRQRRPIIAVLRRGEQRPTLLASMLDTYDRSRTVVCEDADDCARQVDAVLSDPAFHQIVRHAAVDYADPR